MPNMGPVELLVVGLILVAIFGAFATGLVLLVRRASRPPASFPPAYSDRKIQLDSFELESQVRALLEQRKKIHAVKLVREQTGLGLAAAKGYVDDLEAGRIPPALPQLPGRLAHHERARPEFSRQSGADLASRVRDLKLSGRAEQAVFLVRGETGMTESEAQRFVDSIG